MTRPITKTLSVWIEQLGNGLNSTLRWLVLAMVLLQFTIVLLRYVYGVNYVWSQELVIIFYGALFTLLAGYVGQVDAHVRVDVIYRAVRPRSRILIDLIGALILQIPVALVVGYYGWTYAWQAFRIGETSPNPGGLEFWYFYKALIPLFALLVLLQAVRLILRSIAILRIYSRNPDRQGKAMVHR